MNAHPFACLPTLPISIESVLPASSIEYVLKSDIPFSFCCGLQLKIDSLYYKRSGYYIPTYDALLSDIKFLDYISVSVYILLFEIIKHSSSLSYHLKKSSS